MPASPSQQTQVQGWGKICRWQTKPKCADAIEGKIEQAHHDQQPASPGLRAISKMDTIGLKSLARSGVVSRRSLGSDSGRMKNPAAHSIRITPPLHSRGSQVELAKQAPGRRSQDQSDTPGIPIRVKFLERSFRFGHICDVSRASGQIPAGEPADDPAQEQNPQ